MDEHISPDELRLIFEHSNDLIFLLEVTAPDSYRALSVNRHYLNASGLEPSQVIGRRLDEIYSGEALTYLKKRYAEAIRSGNAYQYETLTELSGTETYIDTVLVPAFDADGQCTRLIGISRDISEIKREEKALKQALQRAENYLEISEAMIIALDTQCHLTMMNRKGYQLLGYPEGSLIGKNWCDLVIPENRRDPYMAGFNEFLDDGVPRTHVNYLMTSSGEKLLVRSQNSFMRNDAGEITGVLSSGEDISDRKRAEQAMIANQRSLAVEEVVTAVAHDFNNSLQGIIGNIEIALAQADVPQEAVRSLRAAANLADDAAGRIDALRTSAAQKKPATEEVVAVDRLLAEVIEEARHLWKNLPERYGRKIDVTLETSGEPAPILCNSKDLRAAFYNILKNAIESIETSGRVSITADSLDNRAVITITDTGSGMDDETAARVFQAFFSTKGMEAGRGLGLAASHSIIRTHGGEVRIIDTEPGTGTTFEVTLPLTQLAAEQRKPEKAEQPNVHRVLWVDDDPAVRTVAAGFLKLLNVSGDIVDSGPAAIEHFNSEPYTLVITDIGMQGMSGSELAINLKAINSTIPIVAITGWGDAAMEDDETGVSFDGLLGKPVRLNDLKDLLQQYPA